MPEQMSADLQQVMAQCSRGCFTGLLRVRTREGSGEVRFLSGIQDGIRFDSVEGDAALERLLAASNPEFEAISSLPPIDFGSSDPVPPEGSLARFHAAQLMQGAHRPLSAGRAALGRARLRAHGAAGRGEGGPVSLSFAALRAAGERAAAA